MIDARAFARTWAAAWNRHDLEAVLALFADEAVFTSPLARRIEGFADGIVRGKPALRAYWQTALAIVPDLHFEVTAVSEGVGIIVIGFRNEKGVDRLEILKLADGLVIEGHGTYPAS